MGNILIPTLGIASLGIVIMALANPLWAAFVAFKAFGMM